MSIERRLVRVAAVAAVGASLFGLAACMLVNDFDTSMSGSPSSGQAGAIVTTVLGGGTVDATVIVPSKAFASITQEELDSRQY